MWKITRLYLKNSIHLQSGLGQSEVDINLDENDYTINIFIGKMGSGKTTILGHMQPFATFGTLDIRNQDAVISPNVDGLKIIEYRHYDDHYVIEHQYIWNEKTSSHNIKSYIRRNGEELNPNGNSGSFKDIIRTEFGIEQNFLRILRLGPNVANLINMKSTERKTYAVSLLQNTEIYNMLYKKLSDDLKVQNTNITLLTNKLVQLSADDVERFQSELETTESEIQMLQIQLDDLNRRKIEINVRVEQLLGGITIDQFADQIKHRQIELDRLNIRLNEKEDDLKSIGGDLTEQELNQRIGSANEQLRQLEVHEFELNRRLEELTGEYRKLEERSMLSQSKDQIETLIMQEKELNTKLAEYKSKLRGFKSPYSFNYISSLIAELSSIDAILDDIRWYSTKTIAVIMKSDSSAINYARKQIDKLQGYKYNLQIKMNNVRYAQGYQPDELLYRPPNCPTVSCPYIRTHPALLLKTKSEAENELSVLTDKITKIDADIANYESYPIIYQKISALRNSWKNVVPALEKLGSLKESNLYQVITNLSKRLWYDYNSLIRTMELCKIQDEYFNLETQLKSIASELADLQDDNQMHIAEAIETNRNEYNAKYTELSELLIAKSDTKVKLDTLQREYQLFIHRNELVAEYNKLLDESTTLHHYIDTLQMNQDEAASYHGEHTKIGTQIVELTVRFNELNKHRDSLKLRLGEIGYTKEEFNRANAQRRILKTITRAVSPKEGIPLIMVKIFLDSCRDIVNELIADVFDDTLEILDFVIDDGFRIPYRVNGTEIDDISAASQGQQAIISIALSFALIRQNIFDYNIMLLDEVDGALYPRDREKFVSILFKQLREIKASQAFLISHNNSFNNVPANIIMTTEETGDSSKSHNYIKLYE